MATTLHKYSIQRLYKYLESNMYPCEYDEMWRERVFSIRVGGLDIKVGRSNNMDANDEELTPNTFTYTVTCGKDQYNNLLKNIPSWLRELKE